MHHFAQAHTVVERELGEKWVLGPFPEAPPILPMRCLPRNVIMQQPCVVLCACDILLRWLCCGCVNGVRRKTPPGREHGCEDELIDKALQARTEPGENSAILKTNERTFTRTA